MLTSCVSSWLDGLSQQSPGSRGYRNNAISRVVLWVCGILILKQGSTESSSLPGMNVILRMPLLFSSGKQNNTDKIAKTREKKPFFSQGIVGKRQLADELVSWFVRWSFPGRPYKYEIHARRNTTSVKSYPARAVWLLLPVGLRNREIFEKQLRITRHVPPNELFHLIGQIPGAIDR